MSGRYLEDFTVGEVISSVEDYEITPDNIHAFAAAYDPQPIHLDVAAAAKGFFGELTASGWQTLAVTMRLMVRSPLFASGEVIGVGVNDLRWLSPVRPGDRLRAQAEVLATRRSDSMLGRGFMNLRVTTWRGADQVATQDWTVLVPRK